MKYIIMCGGSYRKFSTPKQLLVVDGEPIVARTIRLLRECGVEDIAISSNNPVFEQFGVPVLHHENNFIDYDNEEVEGAWVDGFYPMSQSACYLFGDVFFSPEAIKKIVETKTDEVEFFASAPPYDKNYIKEWAEPFGFKVENQQYFQDAIRFTKKIRLCFQRLPIAWELWQVLKGTPINIIDYTNYTVINDYTTDVDNVADVNLLNKLMRRLRMEEFKLSKREVFILKKGLIQLNAAEVARNFDKSESKSLDEIERLYRKLDDYAGEDE